MSMDTFKMFREPIATAVSQAVKTSLQQTPVTRLLTDFYGFGLDGGPYNSREAPELLVYGNSILALRYFDPIEGDRVRHVDEISFDITGKIENFRTGGYTRRDRRDQLYDGDFDIFGSAQALIGDDYTELEEKSRVRGEFIDNALRFAVQFGERRPIDGTDIESIVLPRRLKFDDVVEHYGLFDGTARWAQSLADGFNPNLAMYFLTEAVAYHAFDRLLYDPLVEKPIKKFNGSKWAKAHHYHIDLEPFVFQEYRAISRLVNGIYGMTADITMREPFPGPTQQAATRKQTSMRFVDHQKEVPVKEETSMRIVDHQKKEPTAKAA